MVEKQQVKGYFFIYGCRRRAVFFVLYQDAIAMIHFVLNDLGCPAGEGFQSGLQGSILIADFDFTEAFGFPGSAQQGKTAFFRFICFAAADDLRIQHHHVAALTVECNDIFENADHVGSHAHAFFFMGSQGIQQVLGGLQVFCSCGGGFPCQENRVVDNGLNHGKDSFQRISRAMASRITRWAG